MFAPTMDKWMLSRNPLGQAPLCRMDEFDRMVITNTAAPTRTMAGPLAMFRWNDRKRPITENDVPRRIDAHVMCRNDLNVSVAVAAGMRSVAATRRTPSTRSAVTTTIARRALKMSSMTRALTPCASSTDELWVTASSGL